LENAGLHRDEQVVFVAEVMGDEPFGNAQMLGDALVGVSAKPRVPKSSRAAWRMRSLLSMPNT
jgi:hypothetical protein